MEEILECEIPEQPDFMLLTNHAHVLVTIAQKPDVRMREIAITVGITERAVQRIVDDLERIGYITISKSGRRNRYVIQHQSLLPHPLSRRQKVGDLVRFVVPELTFST
jgi:DNA-binding MarR family transcriptional regulator